MPDTPSDPPPDLKKKRRCRIEEDYTNGQRLHAVVISIMARITYKKALVLLETANIDPATEFEYERLAQGLISQKSSSLNRRTLPEI